MKLPGKPLFFGGGVWEIENLVFVGRRCFDFLFLSSDELYSAFLFWGVTIGFPSRHLKCLNFSSNKSFQNPLKSSIIDFKALTGYGKSFILNL